MRKLKAAALVAALFSPLVHPAAPVVSAESEQRQLQQATATHEQQAQLRNQVIADLQIQVTALQEEVRTLRGLMEEQDYKISQLLERQRELYRDIDRRLSGAAGSAGDASRTGAEPATVNSVPSLPEVAPAVTVIAESVPVVAEPVKPGKPAAKDSKDLEAEQKAYDAIFPLVRNKQYSEAVKAYGDFLSKYPDGRNAANARYWLGQVYYVQNSNEDAETQFKLVISLHGDSPKAPDAMLKLATIEERRGSPAAAKALYNQVMQKFPGSSSALAAQKRLQDLR